MKCYAIKDWFVVRKSNELGRNTSRDVFCFMSKTEKAVRIMDGNGLVYWVPLSAFCVDDINDETKGFDTYDDPEEAKALIEADIAKFGLSDWETARRDYIAHDLYN